ncbi:MAG TPA: hypothetical protein VKW78_03700 [Terriglobales bacterium]|nr:hypothetical protein [Terriglobales bacterium]
MKRGLAILFLLLFTWAARGRATEVIDRIVAVVNGKLILQSDVEQEARLEAFLAGDRVSEVESSEADAVLQRMIDRQLIHEQMHGATTISTSAPPVERRVKELRTSIGKSVESDEGWHNALGDAGLTEEEVRQHFADEVQTMRFVETRLRPRIQVDEKSIETYYREELLPELQKSGGPTVSLPDVSRKIRDVLIERELDASLSEWLKSLRQQSEIRLLSPIQKTQSLPAPQGK